MAIFFALPWIALSEQMRLASFNPQRLVIWPRVLFLFLTVFSTSLLFFAYNLFWKHRWRIAMRSRRVTLDVFMNLLLIVMIGLILVMLANQVFDLHATKAYFTFYLFRNIIICIVVLLVTYVVDLIEKLKQEKVGVLMLQYQNAESELAALRSQIDPHFLFNTLTTLSSLVRANSNESISFIDHMADTFRYMLEKREHKSVAVRDELHFLESYLFMMKKRFGESIHVTIHIEEFHLTKSIPQFAIQLAVENAIKHNVVSPHHVLHVELLSNGDAIKVRNNLQSKGSAEGNGLGLDNLAQRYWLMAKKKITVTKTESFFEITLPLL
jgi:two-component system LytT family sensor kinase